MIHNMTEERKKRNRCDVSLPAPLTEEELARLIESVEGRELLHAPGHLRENIFSHLQEEKRRERQWERQRALFSYRVKVLAGMAAALTVLFLVPVDGTEKADAPRTGILGYVFYGGAGDVDQWEQDILERQQEIDKAWERYQAGQARASAGKRYVQRMKEKLIRKADWED